MFAQSPVRTNLDYRALDLAGSRRGARADGHNGRVALATLPSGMLITQVPHVGLEACLEIQHTNG